MISLTNYDFQWARSELVIIYPDVSTSFPPFLDPSQSQVSQVSLHSRCLAFCSCCTSMELWEQRRHKRLIHMIGSNIPSFICLYVFIYIYIYISIYLSLYIYILYMYCVCMYLYIYICVCVCNNFLFHKHVKCTVYYHIIPYHYYYYY